MAQFFELVHEALEPLPKSGVAYVVTQDHDTGQVFYMTFGELPENCPQPTSGLEGSAVFRTRVLDLLDKAEQQAPSAEAV